MLKNVLNVSFMHKDEMDQKILSTLLTLEAIELPNREIHERLPLAIVVVVDVSGSMNERAFCSPESKCLKTRLQQTKEAILEFLSLLAETDQLGIVLFDSKVEKLFPLTLCSEHNVERMKKKIASVECRSCTNITGGLLMGLEMLEERENKDTIASLLLFTDGEANRGIKDPKKIPDLLLGNLEHQKVRRISHSTTTSIKSVDIMKSHLGSSSSSSSSSSAVPSAVPSLYYKPKKVNYLEGENRATIYTFGFGADHSDALLTSISKAGGGMYYFIEDGSVIKDSFVDCLGGLLSIMCRDISLLISPCPIISSSAEKKKKNVVRIRRVRTGYEESKFEDGSYGFEIPYLRSKEGRDMLIQLEFKDENHVPKNGDSLIRCEVEYKNRKNEIIKSVLVGEFNESGIISTNIIIVNSNKESTEEEIIKISEKMIKIEEFELRTMVWVNVGFVKNDFGPRKRFEEARELYESAIEKIRNSVAFGKSEFTGILKDILTEQIKWLYPRIYDNVGASQRLSVFYEYLIFQRSLEEYREKMMLNVDHLIEHHQLNTPSQFGVLQQQQQQPQREGSRDFKRGKKKNRTVTIWNDKLFVCCCCGNGRFECDGKTISHDCDGQSRCANHTRSPLTRFKYRISVKYARKKCTMDHFLNWKGKVMVGSRRSMTLLCPTYSNYSGSDDVDEQQQEVKIMDPNELKVLLEEVGFDKNIISNILNGND